MSLDLTDIVGAGGDPQDIARAHVEEVHTQAAIERAAEAGIEKVNALADACLAAQDKASATLLISDVLTDDNARHVLRCAFSRRWAEFQAAEIRIRTVHGIGPALKALHDAVQAEARELGDDDDRPHMWPDGLRCTEGGKPLRTLRNLVLILTEDPRWAGSARLNLFTSQVEVRGQRVSDDIEALIAVAIEEQYRIAPSTSMVSEALRVAARQAQYHPVREYLDSLQWDEAPRIRHLARDYLRGNDHPLIEAICMRWMVSAVARVYEPGCKVDTVLILQGQQGARKSTALARLTGSEWFADTTVDIHNKDAMAALEGVWVYEFQELDSLRRSEATAIKAFLASQEDRYRPAYGRNIRVVKRQCVIAATTNNRAYLNDPTGARRFWPIEVNDVIDTDQISRDRDQLWAEAVALYKSGEQWWLTEGEEEMLRKSHARYSMPDPAADVVEEFLIDKLGHQVELKNVRAAVSEAGIRCGDGPIIEAMRRLGWKNERITSGVNKGRKRWVYER